MSFNVDTINPAKYRPLVTTLRTWTDTANDFMAQIYEKNRCEKDVVDKVDRYPILRNCESLSSDLVRSLPKPSSAKTTYICKDGVGKVQAVAQTELTSDNLLEITSIVTDPQNILCSVNVKPQSKGAGSALIDHFKTLCVEKKYRGIWIQPVESATPFYSKHGFSNVDPILGFWSLPVEKILQPNKPAEVA